MATHELGMENVQPSNECSNQSPGNVSNIIIALSFTCVFWGGLYLADGFRYGVNDDVFFMELLSGKYMGTPYAHVFHLQYPFSWLLSRLYQSFAGIDWYGSIFLLCNAACLAIWQVIALRRTRSVKWKLLCSILLYGAFSAIWLREALNFTFTTTSAFLGVTACALFFIGRDTKVNHLLKPLKMI